jgi:3-dehydrotetronate 4-kinase
MRLGAIADDLTGASDLASVIRRAGWTVVQTIGVPRTALPPADAVVVSLKTRTIPAADAVAAARAAAAFLRHAGAEQLYLKYCSTFDSTDEGNIGPVIDALLTDIGDDFTIACPAYPAQQRTVYQGHLFVGRDLLSDSPMRDHPLTPMTDANLVRVLGRQCPRPIGLVPLADVEDGAATTLRRLRSLRAEGYAVAIVDSLCDRHLDIVGEACRPLPLLTGGAALGGALARTRGPSRTLGLGRRPPRSRPVVMLSGSCSAATRAQVARAASVVPSEAIDPLALADDERTLARTIEWALSNLRGPGLLIYSSAEPDAVRLAHARLGRTAAARLIESAFARVATALASAGVRTFVVAGGETAGAVVQALGIGVIAFGEELDPGVPWTYSLEPEGFAIAMKSGNFGGPDLFAKALEDDA